MLDDEIQDSDIFDNLHFEDSLILNSAKEVIKEAPSSNNFRDNIDKTWFEKNLRTQQNLLRLKTRIDHIANKYQIELYKLEGIELDSGDYEFVKSRDERIAKMMMNSTLRDKKLTVGVLSGLSFYVDGLLWNLRDLLKLFKK